MCLSPSLAHWILPWGRGYGDSGSRNPVVNRMNREDAGEARQRLGLAEAWNQPAFPSCHFL